MFKRIIIISLFLLGTFQVQADTIKIGLRAHSGVPKGLAQWKPTADYLSETIPEHTFIMVPFVGLQELMDAASRDEFDFILTNPSSSVEMAYRFGASQILTLKNRRQGKPYTKFGAVIFTRVDREDINTIGDLKGKTFNAVSERAFGGWRVAWEEMLKQNVDPHTDFSVLNFSGGIQEDVVFSVLAGSTDAGVVRTDMLERMTTRGLINLADIKVLNSKTTKDFPFLHSTVLYPEWPLIKAKKTSDVIAQQVALALLTMPENHDAANAGKYVGWTVAVDYQSVRKLLENLNVEPFAKSKKTILSDVIKDNWLVILLIVLGFSTCAVLVNRRVKDRYTKLEARATELRNKDDAE